jgi:hypothetical protein
MNCSSSPFVSGVVGEQGFSLLKCEGRPKAPEAVVINLYVVTDFEGSHQVVDGVLFCVTSYPYAWDLA